MNRVTIIRTGWEHGSSLPGTEYDDFWIKLYSDYGKCVEAGFVMCGDGVLKEQ